MVYIYTPNGYVVSLIQTTMGNGTAVEAVYWARDDPTGQFLPCPTEGLDMQFMYGEHLVQLLNAVMALPSKEMKY